MGGPRDPRWPAPADDAGAIPEGVRGGGRDTAEPDSVRLYRERRALERRAVQTVRCQRSGRRGRAIRRALKAVAIAIVTAASVFAAWAALGQDILGDAFGRHLAEARLRAIADGDVAGALSIYRALADQATGSQRALAAAELGEALDMLGREDEARGAFRAALAADPQNGRAAGQLARLGGLGGEPLAGGIGGAGSGSVSALPPGAAGWESLLAPAERSGFRTQVEHYARERAAKALYAAGKRMWARQERDRAVATLGQVICQFPKELGLTELQDIGETAIGGGQPRLAASAFNAAYETVREQPKPLRGLDGWLRFRAGEALMQAGDMAEARVAFREVMSLGPGFKAPNGRALAIPAEIHYRESRGINSWQGYQNVQALFRLGQEAQYARSDPDEAVAQFRRVVSEYPDSNFDGRALVQLASLAWFERQDPKAAMEYLDQVLGSERKNDLWPDGMRAGAWSLFTLGRIRESSGDRQGARVAYRQLLDEWPDAQDHDGKSFASRAVQRLSLLGGLQ